MNTLKHEFVCHAFVPSFRGAFQQFTAHAEALEMEKKMSRGKAAQLQKLECEYLSL